eukprot:CAMPEP_0181403822 /NCGR_PEP_ID=MMETSP1110-20121109/3916_1 /TAXON_ID=174948 /ORGANISM="Symbiodinium sp., Strain CCMP421" /LENGTH=47 /DNA_ID= /DNA_START= /DNA_END= /DNA_ORIENTATION=
MTYAVSTLGMGWTHFVPPSVQWFHLGKGDGTLKYHTSANSASQAACW